MSRKTVSFRTLGCKQNQYDTDYLKETFRQRGFEVLDEGPADIVVINTCAVTSRSAAKCRQAIRAAARTGAKVIVTGCYSQVAKDEIAGIPGVIVVGGVRGRGELASLAEQALAEDRDRPIVAVLPHEQGEAFEETPVPSPSLTRAFMKIQEGCGDFCSYCIVPYARGPSRSRNVDAVLSEAKSLVEKGFKEIVLTGTHLGLYSETHNGKTVGLPEIIRMICDIKGLTRLRISSLEPHDVTRDLIHCLRFPQICHHLHLPLQSGSDGVLRRMGRRYTSEEFLRIVESVREVAPDVGISTDIIAGFPGETEKDFQATLDVARAAAFSRIHAFKFSARPGTRAAEFGEKVADKEKDARIDRLIELGRELSRDFHSKHIGRPVEILVEDDRAPDGSLTGVTRNYIRAYIEGSDNLRGTLLQATVVSLAPDGVLCKA